jgi:hypothetical protein
MDPGKVAFKEGVEAFRFPLMPLLEENAGFRIFCVHITYFNLL